VRRIADALFQVALTLWVGGLWTIGYVVAPTLFHILESRQQAGAIAGHMFEVSGWLGMGLGTFLLLFLLLRQGFGAMRTLAFWLAALMLILTAVSLFGIQPLMAQMKLDALPRDVMDSLLRDRFSTWHGISSSLYLLQSLLGLALLLRVGRGVR